MTLPPESIQAGQCYLTDAGHVRRVVRVMPDGRVQYEFRRGHRVQWKSGILAGTSFALQADCEVPCDWTPEGDG